MNTQHHDVTFKLMLVPIWVATYLYAGRNWQILINGRTGEVHGERPWSRTKIATAVISGILLMVVVAYFLFLNGGTNSSTR